MPKRTRKSKEPDFNQVAQGLVQRSTESVETPEGQMRRVMREMGRRGGKKGGAVRAARMTREQRTASASKAARVRWGKDMQAVNGVIESKPDMEQEGSRLQAAEKLLAILERSAEGLSPEEGERKWDALDRAINQDVHPKTVPRAKRRNPDTDFRS